MQGEGNHSPERNGNPTLAEVKDRAQFVGLAEWKAVDWFNEMEGCGWLDYQHRPIVDWIAVMTRVCRKWEADGRPDGPPALRQNGGPARVMTPLDYKMIIQAKEAQATEIRNKYCSDTAIDQVWSDPAKRKEFFDLKREVKSLTAKLGGMA